LPKNSVLVCTFVPYFTAMPIVFEVQERNLTTVLVWQQTEPLSFFLEQLSAPAAHLDILDGTQHQRKTNSIVLQYLLQTLIGKHQALSYEKDAYGKPYLVGDPRFISVSHSKNVVAVILSDVPVGIDIQFFTAKMDKVSPKFISENEFSFIGEADQSAYYHVLWGAKESMYKADGKRGLDFRQNLHLRPFTYAEQGTAVGEIVKINSTRTFSIHYKPLLLDENFMLVYSIEN
jgi:4'-phosphopantetheinyl transferase